MDLLVPWMGPRVLIKEAILQELGRSPAASDAPKKGCKEAAEICSDSGNAHVKQMRITIGKNRISTRAPNNDELSQDISFTKSDDLIKQNAIIFGKSGKDLTEWQQKVNEAAISLATQDNSLLLQRGKLFEPAKQKVLESGYNFKRWLSRSKKSLDLSLDDKKWAKTSTNERKEMLTRLTEDMKLIDDKMRTTTSLINKYTTVKNLRVP